jgi:hypothetical protein
MERRQFLLSSLAFGACLITPIITLASVTPSRHKPLILHTETIRPHEPYTDPDNIFRYLYPADKPRLVDHGVNLSIGDTLQVRLLSNDMGNHLVGVYRGDLEIARFRSWLVGGQLERGESVTACISDAVKDELFRIDLVLNRPLTPGERIPLLDPSRETHGISAQLAPSPPIGRYRAVEAGWQPVRCLPGHHYFSVSFPEPEPGPELSGGYKTTYIKLPESLHPVSIEQKDLWNPTPWDDLDPAATVLTQHGDDFAYLTLGYLNPLKQALFHAGRVEAAVIGAGTRIPREVLVDLSLVT